MSGTDGYGRLRTAKKCRPIANAQERVRTPDPTNGGMRPGSLSSLEERGWGEEAVISHRHPFRAGADTGRSSLLIPSSLIPPVQLLLPKNPPAKAQLCANQRKFTATRLS